MSRLRELSERREREGAQERMRSNGEKEKETHFLKVLKIRLYCSTRSSAYTIYPSFPGPTLAYVLSQLISRNKSHEFH